MPNPTPRRPGGQPGNTNALKHGFYARRIPGIKDAAIEALQTEFPGFEEEIFTLRIYARHLLENSAECNTFAESVLVTRTLCLCFSTLARLHREHRAYTEKPIETQAALRRAAPDVTDVKPPTTSYDDFADNLDAHFPNRSFQDILHSTDAIPIGTFDPHLPDLPPNLGFPPDHPVTIAATPDLEKLASRMATIAQIAPYYKIEIPVLTKPIDIIFKTAARVRAILGETSQAIAAGTIPVPELLANPQAARPTNAPETGPTWLPTAPALAPETDPTWLPTALAPATPAPMNDPINEPITVFPAAGAIAINEPASPVPASVVTNLISPLASAPVPTGPVPLATLPPMHPPVGAEPVLTNPTGPHPAALPPTSRFAKSPSNNTAGPHPTGLPPAGPLRIGPQTASAQTASPVPPPAGPLRIGPQTTNAQTASPGAPVPPPTEEDWLADPTATLAEERPGLYAAFATDPAALAILNEIQALSNAVALADRDALLTLPPHPTTKPSQPPTPNGKDHQPTSHSSRNRFSPPSPTKSPAILDTS